MKTTITILTVALAMAAGFAWGSTIEVLEGDMDSYHEGDPADTPSFISDALISVGAGGENGRRNFDEYCHNSNVIWTYLFEIPEGEIVTSASIEIRAIGTAPVAVETDLIAFDGTFGLREGGYYSAAQLSDYGFTGDDLIIVDLVMTLDLGSLITRDTNISVPYIVNILPELADGTLDVIFGDDSKIDYALLRIETIPEPSFMLVGGLVLLMVRRKK